jgi:alpha-1,2-mannosyltransferase
VYMGTALALVRGRIVYRDFFMIHPPGIVYVLTPFAALSWFFTDATAFAAARLGMMVLGGLNTFLVGLVAARFGRTAAIASAALYAVWPIATKIERSTWLGAPQNTLLLLAVLVLATSLPGPGATRITSRRAAAVGVLIGLAGIFQVWGLVTAGVIFAWILVRNLQIGGGWLRPILAYATAGLATVAVTFLPFLAVAGSTMIRIVVFDQIGRASIGVGLVSRLRQMEGLPHAIVSHGFSFVAVGLFCAMVLAFVVVAWRRPAAALWVALFLVQSLFLLITPTFYGHYAGWIAPMAAVCIGAVAATAIDWSGRWRRLGTGIKLAYAAGVAAFLLATIIPTRLGYPLPSRPFDPVAVANVIAGYRCPTGDNPTVLILTGTLRRMLDNGCPLLVSPTGVSYDTDRNLRGKDRIRVNQPEYQAAMQAYFGRSDAAIFSRDPKNRGLSDATWAVIRAHLPVLVHVANVVVYLPAPP